jgi:hypothetical protein
MRILEILKVYSQLTHTYESTELRALWPRHDVSIVALNPSNMREAGFEQARRSDIRRHLPILEDLWK